MSMTACFLAISPKLRESLADGFSFASSGMDQYSPFSYIGLGIGLIAVFIMFLSRGSSPR